MRAISSESFWQNCLRCGHTWLKRTAGRPQVCPYCGSRKWDLEKGVRKPVDPPVEAPAVEKKTRKRAKFSVPSLEEVAAYWKYGVFPGNPEQFYDYFTSKGWVVGRAPMKDWKAAARNWARRDAAKVDKGAQHAKIGDLDHKIVPAEVLPPDVPRGTPKKFSEEDLEEYLRTHPGANAEAIRESFRKVNASNG